MVGDPSGLTFETLTKILNLIDEGVQFVDNSGRIVLYNAAMARLETLDPEQVMGRHFLEVIPSLSPETSTIFNVLQTGQAVRDKLQTYRSFTGREITTLNTTVPVHVSDQLVGALEIARDITKIRQLAERLHDLQGQILREAREAESPDKRGTRNRGAGRAVYSFSDIIGRHPRLLQAVQIARKASRTNSSVLIWGETGTGKELFAHSIHDAGPRRNRPFVAQNCAALPEGLLEGILFGTLKGGFTGAVDREGLFEQADGGTLLLDEVDSMSPALQAKLLRALQEGTVRRVGATEETQVDVRVISALGTDPDVSVREGRLRRDLYYRLGVVCIEIPPLRERPDDIPLLTEHFIRKYNSRLGRRVRGLAPEVELAFRSHFWPGNVRELQHAVEAAMNLIESEETLAWDHLPPHLRRAITAPLDGNTASSGGNSASSFLPYPPWDEGETLDLRLAAFERFMIRLALERHRRNITRAARDLGITRQSLQHKIKKYRL